MPRITLEELAGAIDAQLRGDGERAVDGCAPLGEAGASDVSFFANPRYADRLAATQAGAVILGPGDVGRANGHALLVADDPYLAFREALVLLHGPRDRPAVGVSPLASVDPTARLGEGCTVLPFAHVGPHARLGDRVVLHPHATVGPHAVVGHDSVLHPGVCLYDRCVLGHRVTLHAHTTIGQDGLGYATAPRPRKLAAPAPDPASGGGSIHHKIPQIGNVVVGDDVEMGAHCAVDRAAMGSTLVGEGSKFSDHVVIGHGAKIGRHNLLVAFVGIAGSTTTGDHVTMGGHVGVAGHLTIGDRVRIAASAKVMHDLPADSGAWGGVPAVPLQDAKRIVLHEQRLPAMAARLKALEKRIAQLEREP
jgi:UDP-3-O-[3-hydroxymyristoyl] glucosamine N-acyltransferase